eukprot:9056522-Pyramimonas_sp.AAC.1
MVGSFARINICVRVHVAVALVALRSWPVSWQPLAALMCPHPSPQKTGGGGGRGRGSGKSAEQGAACMLRAPAAAA